MTLCKFLRRYDVQGMQSKMMSGGDVEDFCWYEACHFQLCIALQRGI